MLVVMLRQVSLYLDNARSSFRLLLSPGSVIDEATVKWGRAVSTKLFLVR